MGYPSPDRSIFSRFPKCISKDAMVQINSVLLKQLYQQGISIKKGVTVDTDNGFIFSTTLSPASHHDSKYLPYAVICSMHTKDNIEIYYADKGYAGALNREFPALNDIKKGIMRKDNNNAKLTDIEIIRSKGRT